MAIPQVYHWPLRSHRHAGAYSTHTGEELDHHCFHIEDMPDDRAIQEAYHLRDARTSSTGSQ